MSMGMGMSLAPSMRQRQALEQRLTIAQRLALESHLFGVRLGLVGALRNEEYKPKAVCRQCSKELSPMEILKGFRDNDPNDFTTCCPGCGFRFEPGLLCFDNVATIELSFFCSVQVLPRLRRMSRKPPEEIARKKPSEYRSAVIHYGTLRAAFARLGVTYDFPELNGWEAKIQPFLGKMPDTAIAQCVGVSARVIGSRRRKANIPAFSRHKTAERLAQEAQAV